MVLTWKERIYNAESRNTDASKKSGTKNKTMLKRLNPYRFVESVGGLCWKQLLRAIRSQVLDNIIKACRVVAEQTKPKISKYYASDVDSEQPDTANQLCVFSLELSRTSVVQIQLSSRVEKGLLTPFIQLLSLTPTLTVCVEHLSDPASCFVDVSKGSPVQKQYKTIHDYVAGWQYLVAREAVKASISDGNSVTIHNVQILWTKDGSDWEGMFELQGLFCENRSILLTRLSGDQKDDDVSDEQSYLDYVCVRYSAGELDSDENTYTEGCYAIEEKPVWIGHCLSTSVNLDSENKTAVVSLKLLQSRQQLPGRIKFCKQKATIELMPRLFPFRYPNRQLS